MGRSLRNYQLFPRGMVRTALLASACAGPVGILVMGIVVYIETFFSRVCRACAALTDISPDTPLPGVFDLVFAPIVTALLSGLFTVLTVFLPIFSLFAGIFLIGDGTPWLGRRWTWCAIGAGAGAFLGSCILGVVLASSKPLEVVQGIVIGSLTGAICALIAHSTLTRYGAMKRFGTR